MKKFGDVLASRPAGREAFLVAKAYVFPKNIQEDITLDFSGVLVLTPSWADEFITPLEEERGRPLHYLNTENASVSGSLKILKDTAA